MVGPFLVLWHSQCRSVGRAIDELARNEPRQPERRHAGPSQRDASNVRSLAPQPWTAIAHGNLVE
eukprot:6205328-Pleurochrysis_carterae.AAC.3